MIRILLLPLLILLTVAACSPLDEPNEGLVPFEEIPAAWGELIEITKYEDSGYYELWFFNEDTGALTHVPLQRRSWKIKLEKVRTIPGGPGWSARAEEGGAS